MFLYFILNNNHNILIYFNCKPKYLLLFIVLFLSNVLIKFWKIKKIQQNQKPKSKSRNQKPKAKSCKPKSKI